MIVRPTGFQTARPPDADQRIEYQELCQELMENRARNRILCDDVVRAVEEGRCPLVLTERTEHLENLAEQLRSRAMRVITLQGGMGKKELRDAMAALREASGTGKRVIELDGDQHLGNTGAYRTDRRKDALLQEHGYYVLRFLARNLATRLDHVLDVILRALAHRERFALTRILDRCSNSHPTLISHENGAGFLSSDSLTAT